MISVVVPTHRRARSLTRLLASLQRLNNPLIKEILVVGNDEKDLYVTSVSKKFALPIKSLISNEVGVNICRNLGAKHATQTLLWFLDDDCEIPLNFDVYDLVRQFEISHWDFAGGPYLRPKAKSSAYSVAYGLVQESWYMQNFENSRHAWRFLGGNLFVKNEVFQNENGFNRNIIFGGAESEFLARLAVHNYKGFALAKKFGVIHHLEMSKRHLIHKAFRQGVSHGRFQDLYSRWQAPLYQYEWLLFDRLKLSPLEQFRIKYGIELYHFHFKRGVKSSAQSL